MIRLDQQLVERGLSTSRAQAIRAIKEGYVRVDGQIITKASHKVKNFASITINDPQSNWVSRGALKLLAILDDVTAMTALDLGTSTGGFSQVLIERGAKWVFGLDVGHGQIHPKLLTYPNFSHREGFNVKAIDALSFNHPLWPNFDLFTCDLSFISLTKALPAVLGLARRGTVGYILIKPQFELSPSEIEKGGIVRSEDARQRAVSTVSVFLEASGWQIEKTLQSPIQGSDGNVEFLTKIQKK